MIKFSDLETKYNLKTVKSFIADNKDSVLKYAASVGYPVALTQILPAASPAPTYRLS